MVGIRALGGDDEVGPDEAVPAGRADRYVPRRAEEAVDHGLHGVGRQVVEGSVDVDVAGLLDEADEADDDGGVLGVALQLRVEGLDGAGEAGGDELGVGRFAEEGLAVEAQPAR